MQRTSFSRAWQARWIYNWQDRVRRRQETRSLAWRVWGWLKTMTLGLRKVDPLK